MRDKLPPRVGFSAIEGRRAKAQKIIAILAAANGPLLSGRRILDIGSGEIADILGNYAQVVTTDVVDQRIRGRDLPFVVAQGQLLFADASFDLVVSSHAIEHCGDPSQHRRGTGRILRPGELVHLATPNRWWSWGVHTRMPLLHYRPASLVEPLARLLGRLDEPLKFVSIFSLRRMSFRRLRIALWRHRVIEDPGRFNLRLPRWATFFGRAIPDRLLSVTCNWQPTFIALLYPE